MGRICSTLKFNHRFNKCGRFCNGFVSLQKSLTLAWAVTIHKSQGMALEKVVVDLVPKILVLDLHLCHVLSQGLEGFDVSFMV
jgi:hypothetical protein